MSQWIGSSGHRGHAVMKLDTWFRVEVTMSGGRGYAVQNLNFYSWYYYTDKNPRFLWNYVHFTNMWVCCFL